MNVYVSLGSECPKDTSEVSGEECSWSVVIDDRNTYCFLAKEWIPQGFLVSVIVVCIYRDTALILGPAVEAVMRACVGYCTLCCPTFIAPDRLIQSYRQHAKGRGFICNDVIILYVNMARVCRTYLHCLTSQ